MIYRRAIDGEALQAVIVATDCTFAFWGINDSFALRNPIANFWHTLNFNNKQTHEKNVTYRFDSIQTPIGATARAAIEWDRNSLQQW